MKISRAALRIAVDRVLPNKPVHRRVRGIDMVLPRRHLLPHLATETSAYGRNLDDLAALLGKDEDELVVLDVGANVGDTALFVRSAANARIVCVEGDPHWLSFLEKNVAGCPEVAIEPVLLSAEDDGRSVSIVRAELGSSHLLPADGGGGIATVPLAALVDKYPYLANVRLIKSDTDGFDVLLVPAYARRFTDSRPVIFFEYEPTVTRLATPDVDPKLLFEQLDALGYTHALVWNNAGQLLGRSATGELTARSAVLDGDRAERGYHFWDVAVAHDSDHKGQAVLDEIADRRRWVSVGAWG